MKNFSSLLDLFREVNVYRIIFFVWLKISIVGLGFLANVTYASVDLFNNNRGKAEISKAEKTHKVKPKPKTRAKTLNLMFIGVSEFGMTTLYFKDRKNKQLKLQFEPGKNISLPGYQNLIIDRVENRVLYIKDVNKEYCRDNVKKGVYCQSGNDFIEMKMVRQRFKAPTKAKKKTQQPKTFATGSGQMKPRLPTRIDPEDIPKDKRLIKTPFGDRLVPK